MGQEKDPRSIQSVEFTDLPIAAEALKSFARQGADGCKRVRVQFVVEDGEKRELYRNRTFLDRRSKR